MVANDVLRLNLAFMLFEVGFQEHKAAHTEEINRVCLHEFSEIILTFA